MQADSLLSEAPGKPHIYTHLYTYINMGRPGASLIAQLAKNLPAMQETWVQPLGWEDPLEEGMEIHSSILA